MPWIEHSDVAWRLGWLNRHTQDNVEVYYEFDKFDPVLGWISKPNLRDLPVFQGKRLSTNSWGLRGSIEYEHAKPLNVKRVLIFGDSFTFGDEVSDDETYTHYLQERLPNMEIINFGVHGYGHDQMLLLLQRLGEKIQPDIVILGFVYVDIYRNLLKFRDFAKPKFEHHNHQLRLTNLPLPTPQSVLNSERLRSRALDVVLLISDAVEAKLGYTERRAKEMTRSLLSEFTNTVKKIGAVPLLIFLPIGPEIQAPHDSKVEGETFLLSYCADRQITCGTVRSNFNRSREKGIKIKVHGHWDSIGHMIVAEGIAEILEKLDLIQ